MKDLPPDDPPRTVKSRQPKYTHRPIICLTDDELLLETGLILSADALAEVLVTEQSSFIVCQGFGTHLDRLCHTFKDSPKFQYRITPRLVPSRNTDDDKPPKPVRVYDAVTNFVGFAGGAKGKGGKRWTRYHYPIDPIHFTRLSIDELYPNMESRLWKLHRFGIEVRDFCRRHHLQVRPSGGGVAAQLLRDTRFYPDPRRKVPRLINATARPHLPGNFYRLRVEPEAQRYTAVYLDMSNAHHEAARLISFPDANDLHAYGRWHNEPKLFADTSGGRPHLLFSLPGLFRLRIRVPDMRHGFFPPPYMENPGVRDCWIYSNELELVEEWGGEILGILSCLVSHHTETGLNRYAEWALEEIRKRPDAKPWMKPTLHAAYGILAARPLPFETGYRNAVGNVTPTDYPMGKVSIPVLARRSGAEIESQIVNVIHRGMIEAEVRKEVLTLAQQLTTDGYNVLNVYADSLFIEGDIAPLLPHPWRVAANCTNLRFLSATHFISDQESRLPGIPRNLDERKRTDRLIRREKLIRSLQPIKRSTGGSHATGKAGRKDR